jgi:hypothetical protein
MVAPTQKLTCDRTNEAYGKGDAENDHDTILAVAPRLGIALRKVTGRGPLNSHPRRLD